MVSVISLTNARGNQQFRMDVLVLESVFAHLAELNFGLKFRLHLTLSSLSAIRSLK